MKFNINYRGHFFIRQNEFGYYKYICEHCNMLYYELSNDYTIKWSDIEFEIFNEDNVLTCAEVQIKKLIE